MSVVNNTSARIPRSVVLAGREGGVVAALGGRGAEVLTRGAT